MSAQKVEYVATLDSTQLSNGANQASSSLDKVGNSADKSGQKINSLSKGAILTAGASFAGLASNITTTVFAYNDLEDIQIRVKSTALAVSKAQEAVNKLQAEAKTKTLDYQQAIEKLEVATLKNKDAIEDADKANVQFALNLVTMATATIPMSIKGILDLTGGLGGLGKMFKVLELGMGKWILIATGVILAFEGIAHVIKYFTGGDIDITIEKLSGDLMSAMDGNKNSADELTKSLQGVTSEVKTLDPAVANLGSSFVGVPPVIDSTTKSLTQMDGMLSVTVTHMKDVNKELDILKKNDNFSVLINQLKTSQGLAITRELIEIAKERYENGDLRGALEVEKAIQSVGRNNPSLSGKLRSIAEQIKRNTSSWSTISNIGGGVGFLSGTGLSASAITGRQSEGLLGMLNLSGLKSITMSNYTKQTSGFSLAGYVSARLSGGKNSMNSVSKGGNRSSGKSSKHGGANRHDELMLHKFESSLDNGYRSSTGYSLQELIDITGLPLGVENYNKTRSVSGNRIRNYEQAMINRGNAINDDLRRREEARNEVGNRISLLSELASLGSFDQDVMRFTSSYGGLNQNSGLIQSIINSERREILSASQVLGMNQSEIIASRSSILTQNDITNMLVFRERESLAMVSV